MFRRFFKKKPSKIYFQTSVNLFRFTVFKEPQDICIMVDQVGQDHKRVGGCPVSASGVFYSPGEPLESGPEQKHIIWTWHHLPSSEHSGSLGKRRGGRLLLWHLLLLYGFAFVVLGFSFHLFSFFFLF